MAPPCYNQYDHPLLWCEAKRRAEERRIAQETLDIVNQRKENEYLRKVREANEVREMKIKHLHSISE